MKAGSVLSCSFQDLRGKIIAEIINEFQTLYANIENRTYFEEYRNRSYLDGMTIEVLKNNTATPAKALFIDENLCLAVQYEDGKIERLFTGDVSIKKI